MYLNVVQLAESFGVEERVVEGWVRNDSLPHVPDRGRLLFDRAEVLAWAAERGLAARAGFLAPMRAATVPRCRIEPWLRTGGIWRDVSAAQVLDVLEAVVARLPGTTPAVRQLLAQRVRTQRGVTWAPIGGGFALPHLRTPVALGGNAGTLALLFLNDGLPLEEPPPDGVALTRLFFFIAPSPRVHLEALAKLSAALTRTGLRQLVIQAAADSRIFAELATADGPEVGG